MPLISETKLLEQWKKQKAISEGALAKQYQRAKENYNFHYGNKKSYAVNLNGDTREPVVFNKVKPYIDSVVGFMIQLRRRPEYQARVMDKVEQQEFSEYMNSLSNYARDNGNFDTLETRQDREMLITGVGAIDTNIIYENDPNGEIAGECVRIIDIGYDPMSTEPNMINSRWVYRRKVYSLEEALKRFKGSKPEDFEGYNEDTSVNYVYNPAGGEYDKIGSAGQEEGDLIEVYYYQYWKLETYFRAKNPLYDIEDQATAALVAEFMNTMKEKRAEISKENEQDDIFDFDPFAEYLIMTPKIKGDMEKLFSEFNIEFEYQQYLKKCYYTAILSGKTVFSHFKSPDQQSFTIKFKTGCYDPTQKVWVGMVDSLKEPARYGSKALTEILYVIAANSKGGVMYERSAVDNPQKFEQQYASTKAAIMVEDGAVSGNKIAPKAQPALPTGYEGIYQLADVALGEVSGINKEFLGSSENKAVSALLEAQRIKQVVTTLADYFDSIALYQKEHARLMIVFLQMLAENSQGRLISILGEDGAKKYIAIDRSKFADEYDIEIGEAPTSATQKQETTTILLTMADKLALLGHNIYPLLIDYLQIKQSDKIKLKQVLMPSPEQEAEKARQMAEIQAIEQEVNVALVENQKANAARNLAQAQKIMAEIPKVEADADESRANTAKILNEAQQKSFENELLKKMPIQDLNVTV